MAGRSVSLTLRWVACSCPYLWVNLQLLSSSLNLVFLSFWFFLPNGIILLGRSWRGKNDHWKHIFLSFLTCLCLPTPPGNYYNDRPFHGGSAGTTESQAPRKGKGITLQWSPLLCSLLLRVSAGILYFKYLHFYWETKEDLQPAEKLFLHAGRGTPKCSGATVTVAFLNNIVQVYIDLQWIKVTLIWWEMSPVSSKSVWAVTGDV